ncbi:11686_t:CDS:2 [Dentiscutata heterogama]|uniref:11686_t:CDS:1 n=1 Tax=Dentiscutata heterogama TaxID=1316150 RepID=A0ACA9M809_9GLOM|nr:11686_t:CDS:2 [Dentiscutata heterogama]
MTSNKSILISFMLFFSIFSPHVLAVPLSPETQKEPDSNVPPPSNVTEIKFEDLPSSGELYKLSQNPTSDGTVNNSESEQTTVNSQLDSNKLPIESSQNSITRRDDVSETNVIDPDLPDLRTKNPHAAPNTTTTNSQRPIIQSSDATIVHAPQISRSLNPIHIGGNTYSLDPSPIIYKHKKLIKSIGDFSYFI